jgi:SAM-dependent methyltransferase
LADRGPDADNVERRARSFGPAAAIYERSRPGYPADAVGWLVGSRPLRVLDVGAGTGKLTRALVAAGHAVTAVEPDGLMRSALAAAVPGVEILDGAAETLPVGDGSFDAVTAGQAFHWFDADRAFPEIARVLRPGGVLGVVWNIRDERVPWVAEFGRIVHGEDGSTDLPDAEEDFGPLFGSVDRREFTHSHTLDERGLVELAASRSHTLTLPEADRARLLDRVADLARGEAAASAGRLVRLPYRTVCMRASRTGRLPGLGEREPGDVDADDEQQP